MFQIGDRRLQIADENGEYRGAANANPEALIQVRPDRRRPVSFSKSPAIVGKNNTI
jgi:hypothetical protein